MVRSLDAAALRAMRLRSQLLSGTPAGSPEAVVARVVAIQAQAAAPARLAVRARGSGLSAAGVDRACTSAGLVRTWLMRGTLHMVLAADVRWMLGLLGPVLHKGGRRRREQLGLDDATCERALHAFRQVLAGSPPLTRPELVERLADLGVDIDPHTQAAPHLLGYAAHHGLICRGPERAGDTPTYVLLDEWVPPGPALDRDGALAELARRYLAGYGPASVADFLAWSGLPAADGRRTWELIAAELVEVRAGEVPMAALAGTDLDGTRDCPPRLLGAFDALLLGYRGRDLILDPAMRKRVQAGGGIIHPVAMAGGRVAATWRLQRRGRTATLTVEPFSRLPPGTIEGLQAEARDIGRFLNLDLTFTVSQ